MPFTFLSPSIPNSNIKVRWKEQYGSSGFNKKLAGIIPSGIYRGLVLSTSGSNNTVTVVPDSGHQDHLAVCENIDGFSLTFRDATNTTYSLDLSDASLLSHTVVITFFANYEESQDTTASFIAYTLSEYNALSASVRGELVVLGTVVNPAGGNTISSTAITQDRRTIASFNQSLRTWRSVITNPGFERSPASGHVITGHEVEGWKASDATSWRTDNTDTATGTRSIELNVSGAGTYTTNFKQRLGIGVVAGQRIFVQALKKVISAASSGTGTIELGFTGDDGGAAATVSSAFVINGTDGSYQSIGTYLTVPSGKVVWSYISINLASAVYASGGAKIRFDNITAQLEPVGSVDQMAVDDDRLREKYSTALVLEDAASSSYDDIGAVLTFDKSNPTTNEGEVILGRKDGGSGNSPALNHAGRITNLGNSLISSSSDALIPRISGGISVAMGATYTLIGEWTPSGDKPVRIYISSTGDFIVTKNLAWDGAVWNKSIAGADAGFAQLNPDNFRLSNLSNISAIGTNFNDANTLLTETYGNIFNNRTYDLLLKFKKTAKSDVFNLNGRLQRYGHYYNEDFYDALDGNLYTSVTNGSGVVSTSFGSTGFANSLIVTSNPASTDDFLIGQQNLATWNQQTDLSMSMAFRYTGDLSATRKFGLAYATGGPVFNINVGFTQSGGGNLFACVRDATTADTGFAPSLDTWYYALFNQYNRRTITYHTTIEYWISTTEDFNDGTILAHGTALHNDGLSPPPSRVIAPGFFVNTNVTSSSLIVDCYTVWENQGR